MVVKNSIKHSMIAVVIAIMFNAISPCHALSAQKPTELEFILSCNPIQSVPKAARTHITFPNTIGIKSLMIGAIRFYQLFVSPQDTPVCNFLPTCSEFGVQSIRELGIIQGILLTSDRLQRCNGMSTSRYRTDLKSGKFIDPIQIYAEILR